MKKSFFKQIYSKYNHIADAWYFPNFFYNMIFCLGILVGNIHANDISLPSYPVDPSYPQVQPGQQNQKTGDTKNQNPSASVKIEVIAILGTSDEVRGYVMLPEKISFKHYKNALVYEKNIVPDDLQSITIQEYSRQGDNASGKNKITFYQFEPSAVEIKLKDNSIYRIQKIFSFLQRFYIDTNNGRTRLFTIFGDSYEKSKGWRDVESKDPEYHRTQPHPASVKKIIFLRVEKE